MSPPPPPPSMAHRAHNSPTLLHHHHQPLLGGMVLHHHHLYTSLPRLASFTPRYTLPRTCIRVQCKASPHTNEQRHATPIRVLKTVAARLFGAASLTAAWWLGTANPAAASSRPPPVTPSIVIGDLSATATEIPPSVVQNPDIVPNELTQEMSDELGTLWRVEKYKDLTYTQFWNLVSEHQVEQVEFTSDRRAMIVTTKDTAPGGRRKHRLGVPFDPSLYDHLVVHGVFVKAPEPSVLQDAFQAVFRTVFPIWLAWMLIRLSFRLGGSSDRIQDLFMGMQLERVDGSKIGVTFDDIAGIDQVKQEIMEIVTFLQQPATFLEMGARSPAGVLMVGPPGTGKTLLAKAIAGEAGVPFFSVAGTEFQEVYSGVGASRVRDMFEKARKAAPCILFIDEFDGLGKSRSYSSVGDDESVHTINQLLTEMDGFEDNTGVVVMAATNRPSSLDKALIRPGRFDRIIHLPLPNLDGRVGILQVHAKGKTLAPDADLRKIARAAAGFTGAELMNLMNIAAIVSVRQGHSAITDADLFEALETQQEEKLTKAGGGKQQVYEDDIVPPAMRRSIAVYEAAKVLTAFLTPHFDEVAKVSICPGGAPTGYSYFVPSEERLEAGVVTRGFMEAKLVVCMAGRCAERLVLGDAYISTMGAADLEMANNIAREMVYRYGFNKRLGPVNLMDDEEEYLQMSRTRAVADLGTELARIALQEVTELIEGAEAKAYYGLAVNYQALETLYNALLEREVLTGKQVEEFFTGTPLHRFPDPFVDGFGWDATSGAVVYPGSTEQQAKELLETARPSNGAPPRFLDNPQRRWHPSNPYQIRSDLADILSPALYNDN